MKVNHTSLSHLMALLALFTLIYIIYRNGPTFNFSPKHKHRMLQRRTIIIPDKPINTQINSINFDSPADHFTLKTPPLGQNLQNISKCSCFRKWMYPPTGNYSLRLNSSCSDEGTHYQPLQKVISFSISSLPTNSSSTTSYSKGLLRNLLIMRHHYPGYSLRLYTTSETTHPFCSLLCQNPDLFWCSILKTPSHGDLRSLHFTTWRYLPLGDPTVQIFHSRDLSSLISYREGAAVQHWLSDNNHKAIMVMRDQKWAHDAPILGGLWGADNLKLGKEKSGALREQLIWKGKQAMLKDEGGDQDQIILEKVIFYPMAKSVVAYDAYHCKKWEKFTEVRAYPTQREGPFKDKMDFGGNGRNWTAKKCPVECRPDYGKDWIYC